MFQRIRNWYYRMIVKFMHPPQMISPNHPSVTGAVIRVNCHECNFDQDINNDELVLIRCIDTATYQYTFQCRNCEYHNLIDIGHNLVNLLIVNGVRTQEFSLPQIHNFKDKPLTHLDWADFKKALDASPDCIVESLEAEIQND